eukprot:TRINITY_DN4436_c0_g1_i2.p1 TRINITY_DN4436_c0_g1~~TRINITY_DN4436_c0_g1_i2.p1  ORF type:complete len:433 (+),score=71.36 TRINITY_DN4436_c0_g1_i2:83-1381(+)
MGTAAELLTSAPTLAEEWFGLVPNLLEEEGWKYEIDTEDLGFALCSSPWGGRLVRLEWRDYELRGGPVKSSHMLIRPEIRSQYGQSKPNKRLNIKVLEQIAPGEALVERSSDLPFIQVMGIFLNSPVDSESIPSLAHGNCNYYLRNRRDYPKEGDSMYVWAPAGDAETQAAGICLVRPLAAEKRYRSVMVFCVPDGFETARWSQPLLKSTMKTLLEWHLSAKSLEECEEMWALDEDYYVTLSVQSCKRGPPLLPAEASEEALVSVNAGDGIGMPSWRHPLQKFRLSEYLKEFLRRLSYDVEVYDTLDGRSLVHYQCVMRRADWEAVRTCFLEAFNVQKKAYRHALGVSAPTFKEHLDARFVPVDSTIIVARVSPEPQQPYPLKVIVRNTFLDVDEEEEHMDDGHDFDGETSLRHMRKTKSLKSKHFSLIGKA